ncbi:MAG: amino acid/polyamine/organocation transporter, superfamily [Gemmatimonadetes bacterium]|jgi:APA family basic amino acid/polyamine antiporter|nr:amino acid/polyamine/organocation transporter, superfamily [Gemmatimonadota bacterium]
MSSSAVSTDATPQSGTGFVKAMSLTDATMLVAGSMIGSGIFIVSASMARGVPSPLWLMLAWVLSSVMTVLGALAYGELAAMYPRAGGQYVFLRESMGPLMGFLYGWTFFIVIQTGTIAAVAVAFGRFLGVLFPGISPDFYTWFPRADVCVAMLGCTDPANAITLGLNPQRLVGLLSVAVLTWVNLRGVREGKLVQTTLTSIKTLALALLIILGLTVGRNATAIAANFSAGNFSGEWTLGYTLVVAFGAAMVGSLFSSDAWNGVTFAAAEVKNPARNLPLALVMGTGLVCVLYILANLAYLSVLPFGGVAEGATVVARGIQHATQDRVATAVVETIFGVSAATIMAVAILVSTFGCNNGLILSGARVLYAMAGDGLFFRKAGTLNRNNVPAFALVVQSVWTALLCLTGTYNQLLNYVIFAALLFYVFTTVGLFLLRARRPDLPRPYRAVGYPVLPALYILLCCGVMVLLLLSPTTRTESISGIVLVLIGIPVFYLWRRAERLAVAT